MSTRAEIGKNRRSRTRSKLVQTMMELFSEQRMWSTTIDDVIQAAGVSRGTFYNYFDDIESAIEAVGQEVAGSLSDVGLQKLTNVDDAAIRIAFMIGLFYRKAAEDPQWGEVLLGYMDRSEYEQTDLMGVENLVKNVRSGRKQGLFTLNDDEVANDIVVCIGRLGMRSLIEGRASSNHTELIIERILVALGMTPKKAVKTAITALALIDDTGEEQ